MKLRKFLKSDIGTDVRVYNKAYDEIRVFHILDSTQELLCTWVDQYAHEPYLFTYEFDDLFVEVE